MRIISILCLACATLSLAACGKAIPAPSLAPRAVEKQPVAMPEANALEDASPADAELVGRIAAIVAAADAGAGIFASQRARAEKLVTPAAGASPGSDGWIAVQEALTALDSARGATRDAAAALDALRQDANAAPGNRAAIDLAAARVSEIDAEQAAAVKALARRLR